MTYKDIPGFVKVRDMLSIKRMEYYYRELDPEEARKYREISQELSDLHKCTSRLIEIINKYAPNPS